MRAERASHSWVTVVSLSAFLLPGPVSAQQAPAPTSKQKSDSPPVEQFAKRKLHRPPPLRGTSASVAAFIDWAGRSAPVEREDGRKAIQAARGRKRGSKAVARELCAEAFRAIQSDHTRALLVISLLGELRDTRAGQPCLAAIVRIPAPAKGRVERESGRILGAESLEMLQAKAVDGLAYLRTGPGDAEVLRIVTDHPLRAVRAEAIEAYLWNHKNSAEARASIEKALQPGDEIFLRRLRREDGELAASFDAKVAAFLQDNPEAQAPFPVPACIPNRPNETPSQDPGMHPIEGFVFGSTCGASAPQCGGTCPDQETCAPDALAGCICR